MALQNDVKKEEHVVLPESLQVATILSAIPNTVTETYPKTISTVHQQQQDKLTSEINQIIKSRTSRLPNIPPIPTLPHRDKILDFLGSIGKVSVVMLAVTPLPTFFGVWNKPKNEQIQRVESISFGYLLLCILCNSIWTSYAFKTQNIDLAIISVIPLLVAIILVMIYLTVKPESALIQQFFGTVLISQIFNFDLLPLSICGLLGAVTSVMTNGISLFALPDIIETRDVSQINYPL